MQSWGAVGVALLVPLLSTVPATAQCAPGGTNLAGWWPGDNHTYNVINQRAATVQGAVTYAPGMVGDAFHFEGAGKVRIPEATSIDLSRTNRWTITAWVKPSTLDGSASPLIYTEGNRVAALGLQQTSGKLVSLINGANPLESSTAVPANTWTHVALVLDRTTRTLYVNGTAAGTAAATPTTTADSTGSAIGGATTDDATAAFQGDLDEITVHRRALTADEIAALHAAGSAGMCFGDGAPAFLLDPQPQVAPLFGEVTLTGLAMGSPRPTYQWLLNDAPLAGETGFMLHLADLTPANNGVYKLVATSGAQSVTSAGAQLTVQHCAATPDGLVAWWPADGNGLEFTGNHLGEVWGNVTFPAGVAGQTFSFDGTNAYVAVPDSPALSPHVGVNGEMTVEAWVNLPAMPLRDAATAQDRRVVLAKGDPGRWEYGMSITTTGVPEFFVWKADGTTYASVAAGKLLLNQWHHLVATLKKGTYLRLYQDGVLMAESTTFSGSASDTGSPLYVGRRGDAQFLRGKVDEPALYNRALSGDEIAVLYAGGTVGKCYGGGPQPVFVQEPADEEALLLNSVTLKGLALGTPRPAFQWYHNGSVVGGATNSALTLTKLSQADAGHYVLAASNQFGVTQSRTATLTLVPFGVATESFELGWNGWSAEDYSIWQVGRPTSGPGKAHSGTNCVATVLGGNYPENRTARLVSPAFMVPAADQYPRLRFWHWWSFSYGDAGVVQVSKDNGASWQNISPHYGEEGTGKNYTSLGQWTRASLDLTAFAGQTVRLGLYFFSADAAGGDDVDSGWYIDDLMIETGPLPAFAMADGFEDAEALNRWTADHGVWEIGVAASGPGAAHSGTNCLATVLTGNYNDNRWSRMQSAAFMVPAADQHPRLRFWHWWSFSYGDGGVVQVSKDNGASWQNISPYYGEEGTGKNYTSLGQWTRASLDLTAFAGQTVRLGLYFFSADAAGGDDVDSGWYIDDLMIETGPLPAFAMADGFEDAEALNRWTTDHGVWEIGVAASGPGAAHSGTNCLATVLTGNYNDNRWSRMQSAAFMVPAADQHPRLRFWHWWSFSYGDGGVVQVSKDNGASWQNISPYYGEEGTGKNYTSLGQWTRASLDLTAFAGQTVRLGLYFFSADAAGGDDVDSGWYIDDLMIQIGNIGLADVPDWQVDEKAPVSFKVNAVGANANSSLSFSLPWAPQGAWIDPETGVFSWTPSERQGPGVYNIPVYVVDYGNGEANEMTTVKISVNEVNERPWLLSAVLAVQPGQTLNFPLPGGDRDWPRNPLKYTMTGAPAGATLSTNTGVLHWAVPANAAPATYQIGVMLTDNASPKYTTNNTVTLTVTPNVNYGLSIRPLGGSDFEFTIHDTTATDDYVLQSAPALVDQAEWQFNGEAIPTWCSFVDVTEEVEWLTWDDFVQQHLQRTEWQDVTRVSPTAMPFTFTVGMSPTEPMGLFRLVRVRR